MSKICSFLKGIEFYFCLRAINMGKCMLHTIYVWVSPRLDEGRFRIMEASISVVRQENYDVNVFSIIAEKEFIVFSNMALIIFIHSKQMARA